MYRKTPLLQLLYRQGIVPPHIPEDCLVSANELPIRAAAKLLSRPEAEIALKVAAVLKLDFIDLEDEDLRKTFTTTSFETSLDTVFCWERKIAPLYETAQCVVIAVADPLDVEALQFIGSALSSPIRPVIAEEVKILRLLGEHFPPPKTHLDSLIDVGPENLELVSAIDQEYSGKGETPPIIKLCNQIIINALKEDASDVHLEPLQYSLDVRYRIDGVMHSRLEIPKRLQGHVISRLKLLAGMDIAEKRKPQDGRFRIKINGEELDLRVSAVPVSYGENLVLRLLRPNAKNITLDGVGLRPELQRRLIKLLHSPGKMLIVTGPTGSGKTTTLYSCIKQLTDGSRTIVTVENPIEYRMNGVQQIQVNEYAGVTFPSVLRSLLRQDPDVIMIGEIRDGDTAQIAIQAAETGHLVLSTLHTNDAPSAISRLVGLGVTSLSSALAGVIAQRLVRRICPKCPPVAESEELLDFVSAAAAYNLPAIHRRRGEGCNNCSFTGYKGRVGLFSFLEITDSINALIHSGASIQEIETQATMEGYVSLERASLEAIVDGQTTVEEVKEYFVSRTVGSQIRVAAKISFDNLQVEPTRQQRPRLLLVEDDDDLRYTLVTLLARERYEVVEARNGAEAIDKVFDSTFELVLCDLKMPVMDGQEFLSQVKAHPQTKNIPVVILTASDDEANEVTLLNLGARDFVSKTSTPKVICTRVRRAMQR